MKRGIFVSLVLLFAMSSYGQNSYYETAESITSGVTIINGKRDDNFHICKVFEEGKFIRYSPYEVKQYRLKDGPEYISTNITVSDKVARVFLERLIEGKSDLYYYLNNHKSYFFWKKDSTELYLIPENIGKEDNTLADFLVRISSDCPEMAETARVVKYNRVFLTRFINSYNECNPGSFLKIRYGVLLGLSTKKLAPSLNNSDSYLTYFDFKQDMGLAAGAFVNIPVALSNVALQIELLYNQHKFSYNAVAGDTNFDFEGDLYALKMPFLVRYSHPLPKLSPYVIVGPVLEFNFRHDFTMYQTPLTSEVVVLPESDYTVCVKDFMKGFSAGAGLEYKLNGKQKDFLEFRYDYLANYSAGSFINNSGLNLMTGISF